MNYNKYPQSPNRWRAVSIVLFCLLVVIGIIYMKHSSGEQKLLVPSGTSDTAHQVAVPDTTIAPEVMPLYSDTVQPTQLPDTILGRDTRSPYEAGYDDGYAAGCDDGAAKADHATYDETNNFATKPEQQNYVRGYREGYAKGYDNGRQGKQFNI